MTYRISGLSPVPFRKFYGLSDMALNAEGIVRYVVDEYPGFPDRITMEDIPVGETALLINYEHLSVSSPYSSRHAIFIREGASTPYEATGTVPDVMKRRVLALRGFDDQDFILDADLAEGDGVEPLIHAFFDNPNIRYIQAYNAKRGCYSGLIERA